MGWGRRFGWRRWIGQLENIGKGPGRRCWRLAYLLAKLKGDSIEKYLLTRKPCWMIVQEILEELTKKKKNKDKQEQ